MLPNLVASSGQNMSTKIEAHVAYASIFKEEYDPCCAQASLVSMIMEFDFLLGCTAQCYDHTNFILYSKQPCKTHQNLADADCELAELSLNLLQLDVAKLAQNITEQLQLSSRTQEIHCLA